MDQVRLPDLEVIRRYSIAVRREHAAADEVLEALQSDVEAIKRAEDSDAVIVRLYEAWGGRCRARVRTSLPASRAYLCDLMERDRDEISIHAGELEVELAPFKILTLKLTP